MKFLTIAVFAVLAVSAVLSLPLDEFEDVANLQDWDEAEDEAMVDDNMGLRQRRVTCDLFSYGGKVGHSACAANCLSMGKAGGSCNGGVCQCRKTKFSDLWKKRFG